MPFIKWLVRTWLLDKIKFSFAILKYFFVMNNAPQEHIRPCNIPVVGQYLPLLPIPKHVHIWGTWWSELSRCLLDHIILGPWPHHLGTLTTSSPIYGHAGTVGSNAVPCFFSLWASVAPHRAYLQVILSAYAKCGVKMLKGIPGQCDVG